MNPQTTKSLLVLAAGVTLLHGAGASEIDFNRDIRPILSQNCFACHGPDAHERKAKLRLDTEEGSRDALTPGNPGESEMIARILSDDPDEQMPPPKHGKTIKSNELDLLKTWIESGAVYAAPWAYVPPEKHAVPDTDHKWSKNWVDQFILKRLEQESLRPSEEADRTTLIRRLHFDLTGLPPAPGTVDDLLASSKFDLAYARLVDQLLDSDHFGERMAIYWLDLVRFADTVGYHGDQDQNITPYRDYVIDAFNDNLPFDQFTREQLAGDLLDNPSTDQKIATGYNRLLQTSHEGGVQPQEYLAIYAADRIRNLSGVWMGGTLGCAQCHDHKFDPYTARDFYSMSAFFADIDEEQHFKVGNNQLPTKRPPEIDVLTRRDRERLAELESSKAAQEEIEAIKKRTRRTMITVAKEPRTTRILPRGNWLDDSGEIVAPAIPAFLGKLDTGEQRATRLDLANWLIDPQNGSGGLTARVFSNRLWYLFFGEGISTSLGDFGGQGTPPTHPQLLDNLAVEFYTSGWDIKHMIRLLVTSRTYRQSSIASDDLLERDPDNRLFARQSRYRLPAEIVRDNALAISGLLNFDYGGGSAKPHQPAGYYRHLNFPVRKYQQHADAQQYRRGVYIHWQRQFLHPMLKAMDAPSREECTARRPRSNTPTAAMVLLNDPTFIEAAAAFAERILSEGGTTDQQRLDFAYRTALSRRPDAEENRLLAGLLATQNQNVWQAVARAILNLSETTTRN